MTAFEEWKTILDKYNIVYAEQSYSPQPNHPDCYWNDSICLETEQGFGYTGFCLVLAFNKDGSWKGYGVFE